METKQKLLATLGVALLMIGGGLISQKDRLSAYLYFKETSYTVAKVEKQQDAILVTLELTLAQFTNGNFKDCPFSDDPVWKFQSQDEIKVQYELSGTVVDETTCPRDWSLTDMVDHVIGGS